MDKHGDFPKRDWNHRLSLRGSRRSHQSEVVGRSATGSLKSTRRWASLRQHSGNNDGGKPRVELLLDPPGSKPSTPSSQPHSTPHTPNTPKTPHTPVKKSNWEVIEHFTGPPRPSIITMNRGSEAGVGINVTGKEPIQEIGSNAGITLPTGGCALCRFLSSLCTSHRFKNLQVEMLYQRYFLRMNQSNMTHVLGLLVGLAFALGLLLIVRLMLTNSEPLLTLLQRPENLSLGITLIICIIIYAALVAIISRPGINEIWLAVVSGAVLVTLLALQVTLNIHLAYLHEMQQKNYEDGEYANTSSFSSTSSSIPSSKPSKQLRTGGPLAAAWAVCFFIYMAYALLPIRLRHACIAGMCFSVAHLVGALLLYPQDYPAIMAHVILFVSLCIYLHEKERFLLTIKDGAVR
ncbi:adenylate cyclase type 6 isoform X1 [Vespula maculifrons]|uniref:Adenylate cyclase type 6 isoform X1 n=1 Tax=Vespula maculifrons TaxID=7453 RepID=A0ABD2B5T2_VESMC